MDLCAMHSDGLSDKAWVVAPRRRILREERKTEKGKPGQGENKVTVWLSPKLGFQLASKTRCHAGLWDAEIHCQKKKKNAVVASPSPKILRVPKASLEEFKAQIWLHICDLKFCDLQREWGCFLEGLRLFPPSFQPWVKQTNMTEMQLLRTRAKRNRKCGEKPWKQKVLGLWQNFSSRVNFFRPQ